MDRHTDTTARDHTALIVRAAWLCAFVLPLVLATLLLGVSSAGATPPSSGSATAAFEEEVELEAEGEEGDTDEAEFAAAECEIAEEEAAEGEITAAEAKAFCEEAKADAKGETANPSSTDQCILRSVHAHAVVRHDRLKLTLAYTTTAPVTAIVELQKGATHLGSFKRHLGKSGVLRFTEKLGSKRIKQVTVSFEIPSCGKLRTKSVKVG